MDAEELMMKAEENLNERGIEKPTDKQIDDEMMSINDNLIDRAEMLMEED